MGRRLAPRTTHALVVGVHQNRVAAPQSCPGDEWVSSQILACFSTLQVFCSRVPTVLTKHLSTLTVYLKEDARVERDALIEQVGVRRCARCMVISTTCLTPVTATVL